MIPGIPLASAQVPNQEHARIPYLDALVSGLLMEAYGKL